MINSNTFFDVLMQQSMMGSTSGQCHIVHTHKTHRANTLSHQTTQMKVLSFINKTLSNTYFHHKYFIIYFQPERINQIKLAFEIVTDIQNRC